MSEILPTPSLDHLRVFTAVVDEGSFSAAARRLGRSQPVVSYAIATLEGQLGMALFERGRRRPILTERGSTILAYARRMGLLHDQLMAGAANLTQGIESSLTLAVDAFFPTQQLAVVLCDFADRFPATAINLQQVSRDQAVDLVLERKAQLGISASDSAWTASIEAEDFGALTIVAVAAPQHPLARATQPLANALTRDFVQITNRDAGRPDESRDVAINSARLWRTNSLEASLALVRAGTGWSYLPLHLVQAEIDNGQLVQLQFASRAAATQPFSIITRADAPPGPAGRWLRSALKALPGDI